MAIEPTQIEVFRADKRLVITWSDAHVSPYEFFQLRGHCPCAACQGHGIERKFIANDAPSVEGIAEVGSYALNIVWTDGHRTGIYTFDYLRQLCGWVI